MEFKNENDTIESKLQEYCDEFYQKSIDGIYYAHQPIYGYRTPYAETSQIARYMITRSILDVLARYKFNELIDISAAEGYTSHLIKTLFGAKVRTTDWAESVCVMARKIFGLDAQTADIKNLPFKDNEFEVVLCSETLEHIPDWRKGFDELVRITDKLLVITVPHDTIEFVEYNRQHVFGGHINHFEISTFDFIKEMGYNYYIETSQCPLLLKPRVLVEGYKKEGKQYALYNSAAPILKKLFGVRTAQWLIDNDKSITEKTKKYGDIAIVIEKKSIEKNSNYKPIKAKDFMGITVPHFYLNK